MMGTNHSEVKIEIGPGSWTPKNEIYFFIPKKISAFVLIP